MLGKGRTMNAGTSTMGVGVESGAARVLVAVDGSPGGLTALRAARQLVAHAGAAGASGAAGAAGVAGVVGAAGVAGVAGASSVSLALVHVVDPLPAISPEVFPSASLFTDLKIEGRAVLDLAAKELGCKAELFLELGRADHAVCERARAWGATLVVVGTHGRTGLSRVMLGSVAEHVVRHAPCSVLVVR